MPLFLVFTTFFIWSTCFTLGKTALEHSTPLFLTGIRMVVAGLMILVFLACARPKTMRIKKHHLFPLLLLALTAVYLTNAFEFWGLQYLTSAKACFIYSLSPFFSALFSYLQFKEKITSRKMVGLLIGFVGFLPFLLSQRDPSEGGGVGIFSWPELSLMAATMVSMYGWVLLRKLGKDEDGLSPLMANGTAMCLGGVFALIHSFLIDTWNPVPVTNYFEFSRGVLSIVVVSNLICYNLYGWLLKRFTATFLSFAGLITPLCAAFFGWLLRDETVSWTFFLSMSVIAFGLWLVYAEELRLGYIRRRVAA